MRDDDKIPVTDSARATERNWPCTVAGHGGETNGYSLTSNFQIEFHIGEA